jgi:hypothetical protein
VTPFLANLVRADDCAVIGADEHRTLDAKPVEEVSIAYDCKFQLVWGWRRYVRECGLADAVLDAILVGKGHDAVVGAWLSVRC